MSFMIDFCKKIAKPTWNYFRNKHTEINVNKIINKKTFDLNAFDFNSFRDEVLSFIAQMECKDHNFEFYYSKSSKKPSLYASAYACLTLSLLGKIESFSEMEKLAWGNYFDSFQSPDNGLFYDKAVASELYNNADWWGARHLALHMINAYTNLDLKPKVEFKFLSQYYLSGSIDNWLSSFDWKSQNIGDSDIDNKIMNIGCLLQYQRDRWSDIKAGEVLTELKDKLKLELNQSSGMWGGFDLSNAEQRSRAVQFAYHLFAIFLYDGEFDFDAEKIVKAVLATQNKYGGYGVKLNSSACEDIDSIDLLIKFRPFCKKIDQEKIDESLRRAFSWVLVNQVDDGGFVFRLNEPFIYGNAETSSDLNCGAMLPTWFRLLSLAYMSKQLSLPHAFKLSNCPGYEFL
jgi:hypothetical protein